MKTMWGSRLHLSVVRQATLIVWFVIVAATPYETYAVFSADLIEGWGAGGLVLWPGGLLSHWLLTKPVLLVLKILTMVALALTALSTRAARTLTLPAFAAVAVLDAVTKAIGGFANHSSTVPLLMFGVCAMFRSVRCLSLPELIRTSDEMPLSDTERRLTAGVITLLALVVTLPYSFIGIERLQVGRTDMFTGTILLQYLSAATRSFEAYPAWFEPAEAQLFLNVGFLVVTLCEASSALILVFEWYRKVWLVVILGFQVSTMFLMNIFFWENAVLVLSLMWWGWTQQTPAVATASAAFDTVGVASHGRYSGSSRVLRL